MSLSNPSVLPLKGRREGRILKVRFNYLLNLFELQFPLCNIGMEIPPAVGLESHACMDHPVQPASHLGSSVNCSICGAGEGWEGAVRPHIAECTQALSSLCK